MPKVHSQELLIAAPVRTGVGLIAMYKEVWKVVLSERYCVRLYMAVDDPSLTLTMPLCNLRLSRILHCMGVGMDSGVPIPQHRSS